MFGAGLLPGELSGSPARQDRGVSVRATGLAYQIAGAGGEHSKVDRREQSDSSFGGAPPHREHSEVSNAACHSWIIPRPGSAVIRSLRVST
jgi:hypothetical protein